MRQHPLAYPGGRCQQLLKLHVGGQDSPRPVQVEEATGAPRQHRGGSWTDCYRYRSPSPIVSPLDGLRPHPTRRFNSPKCSHNYASTEEWGGIGPQQPFCTSKRPNDSVTSVFTARYKHAPRLRCKHFRPGKKKATSSTSQQKDRNSTSSSSRDLARFDTPNADVRTYSL